MQVGAKLHHPLPVVFTTGGLRLGLNYTSVLGSTSLQAGVRGWEASGGRTVECEVEGSRRLRTVLGGHKSTSVPSSPPRANAGASFKFPTSLSSQASSPPRKSLQALWADGPWGVMQLSPALQILSVQLANAGPETWGLPEAPAYLA